MDDFTHTTTTTGRLTLGGRATGAIDVAGDRDWFRVTLLQGQSYIFTMTESNASLFGMLPEMALYGSDGTLKVTPGAWSAHRAQVGYTAQATGTYYLETRSMLSASVGGYSVAMATGDQIDDIAGDSSTLARMYTYTGNAGRINYAGDVDWFRVDLVAGGSYIADMTSEPGLYGMPNPYLRIVDSAGNVIASDDDSGIGPNAQISFTAPSSGRYYISAASVPGLMWGGIGNYAVMLYETNLDDYSANITTTGRLSAGTATAGEVFFANDTDWFRATLTAGYEYIFDMQGGAGDPLGSRNIQVFSSTGKLLEGVDTGTGNARLSYIATASGTYFVSAGSTSVSENGRYTLSMSGQAKDDYAATSATAGRVTIDAQVQGMLEAPGDVDWFAVTVAAGQTLHASLLHDIPLYLRVRLLDSTGKVLTSSDAANSSDTPTLSYKVATGGTYFVSAGSTAALTSNAGRYSVKVWETVTDDFASSAATTGTIASNLATGKIESAGDNDWFGIALTAGNTYTLTLAGNASAGLADPYLRLYGGASELLAANDNMGMGLNAGLHYAVTTSGTYYVSAASATATGTGGYTVTASAQRSPPEVEAFLPGESAVAFAVVSDIIITFDTAIAHGSGTITLNDASGVILAAYATAPGGQVAIDGNRLTINPASALSYGSHYTVTIGASSIASLDGSAFVTPASFGFVTGTSAMHVHGSASDDVFFSAPGRQAIDGGAGLDTLRYAGPAVDYALVRGTNGFSVTDQRNAGSLDSLFNIERLQFSDGNIALDTDGTAGQAYRIYRAALDRAPDGGGLGFWIAQLDAGTSLAGMAAGFIASAEFTAKYGANLSNSQLVAKLYQNVLHRPGDAAGVAHWTNVLDTKAATAAEVLAAFSESPENQAALVELIGNGIAYLPYI